MRRQRARALEELYGNTQRIFEPEITPVLKGNCRIQGPGDEVDIDVGTNLVISPTEKGFEKFYLNENIPMKASGTCNVCAAPCSSCMHYNRALSFMESKAEDGASENSCGRKDTDNCSVSNSEMLAFYKSKSCDTRTKVAIEMNKIVSTTSSHDSYSENAESKGILNNSDTHDVSESVDMPLKVISSETVEENQLLVENNVSFQSPKEVAYPSVIQGAFSSHQGDTNGLECNGDNISCITGTRDVNLAVFDDSKSLVGKNGLSNYASTRALHIQGLRVAVQGQASSSDIIEIEGSLHTSVKCPKDSSQMKNSCPNPLQAGLSSPQGILSSVKPSSDEKHSYSSFKIGNSRDTDENPNPKHQVQPSQISIKPFISEMALGSLPPDSIYQCSETETQTGGIDGNPKDASIRHSLQTEHHVKPSSSMETSNVPAPHSEPQTSLEGHCPDPEPEEDVKVCDICGDAGREDLLAICRRCSDGAEHTYCMRIKLDKVPEDDWVCEECKSKETVTDKVEKAENVSGSPKALLPNERAQKVGSNFNAKLLPKLDISATDVEVQLPVKGLQSPHVSSKRPGNADVTSLTNKKPSETVILAASPSRKSNLSREGSFKNMDAGKAKQSNVAPSSACHSSMSSQGFSHSLATVSNSSKIVGQLQHPWGLISRSSSFNSPKLRAKTVMDHALQRPKVLKEHTISDSKEGFTKALGKSVSFKNINSGCVNVELIKSQFPSTHRPEESRNLQQTKERVIERKNSFMRTSTGISLASAPSISVSKTEPRTLQNAGKVNTLAEPTIFHTNKVSEELHDKDKGLKELKKQEPHVSKISGIQPSIGARSCDDQKSTQMLPPREDAHTGCNGNTNTIQQHIPSHSFNHDEKLKESSLVGGSRSSFPASKRILRCQKCNEMGHSTQFCSVDKLKLSALKPSLEWGSREAANKGNKWKDAVDSATPKSKMQKNMADVSEGVPSIHQTFETIPQTYSTRSLGCTKDTAMNEMTGDKQNNSRDTIACVNKATVTFGDVKQYGPQMMGNVNARRDGESNTCKELKTMASMQILPEHHSVLFDPSRISALPDHEYTWQGSFVVKRDGGTSEMLDGFQAHLSTCASPRVLNVVNKFPDKVQLEELSLSCCWPVQFQEKGPTEENIALFFFAKDVSSYEISYSKLLEAVLRNDLALKGKFDGIELLIFPSSKLPEKSQRWNRLLFLWGVFRERRINCLENFPSSQSKICVNNYLSQHDDGFTKQLETGVSVTEKESLQNVNKDTSGTRSSPDKENGDSKNSLFLEAGSRIPCLDNVFNQTSVLGPIGINLDSNGSTSIASNDLLKIEQTNSCTEFAKPIGDERTTSVSVKGKSSCSRTCQKDLNMDTEERIGNKLRVFHGSAPGVRSLAVNELPFTDIRLDSEPPDLNVDLNTTDELLPESTGNHKPLCFTTTGSGDLGSKDETKREDRISGMGTSSDGVVAVGEKRDGGWISEPGGTKRTRSCSPQSFLQSSAGTSAGTSGDTLWRRGAEHVHEASESKKRKIQAAVPSCSTSGVDSFGDRSSSKVHPLLAKFLDEHLYADGARNSSKSPERSFFPLDSASMLDARTGSMIPLQILSSDDEPEAPNLDLALCADKRPGKQEMRQASPPPAVGETKRQGKQPLSAAEDDDDDNDGPASLSLFLAFPFSGRKQVQQAASVDKAPAPPVPKRSEVDTSLLLFGGLGES